SHHAPEPLAARRDQIVGDLRNHRHLGAGARQDGRIDALHVGCHELDQPLDRGRALALKGDDARYFSLHSETARPYASAPALARLALLTRARICQHRIARGHGLKRPQKAKTGSRTATGLARYSIAVLVPCYNEEKSIAKVVADFGAVLPAATIFVFDNNSTDQTIEIARAAG